MRGQQSQFGCATEFAMDLLRGKWAVVILARIKEGPQRYADLRGALPVADKVLTTRLHDLRERGLIERDEHGRYVLTDCGQSLRDVLDTIYAWGLAEAERRSVAIGRP